MVESVGINFLKTTQEMVYRERVDYYKECYRLGTAIPPIEVFPFGEFDDLWIFNGNHRAFARLELGLYEIGINLITPRRMGGEIKKIEELLVLPGDRTDKEGFQLPEHRW